MGTHGTGTTQCIHTGDSHFRPFMGSIFPAAWLFIGILFMIHAGIRFGGLWYPFLFPISLIFLWPLPWVLAGREGRIGMGFRRAEAVHWYLTGPLLALVALVLSAAANWLFIGVNDGNWLIHHAKYLDDSLANLPSETELIVRFSVATLPAMLFSPLGEEFFYRGIMQTGLAEKWGLRSALILQAAAFSLVHLAHYGLKPFHPLLILLFIPSMFAVALLLGWIRYKSGSIWVVVWSHAIFNLGLNGIAFWI